MSNTMLQISGKKTVSVNLRRALRDNIKSKYSARDFHTLEADLRTLDRTRSYVVNLAASTEDLQRYYRALCAVESLFPISADEDQVNAVTFTWYDAFNEKMKTSQQNIHLEKAAVVFNLGAVHSQNGKEFGLASMEARKKALHSFRAAAGAFAFLRDKESVKVRMGGSATVDLSVECAGMLETLMLAQAQECFYESAIAQGSLPGTSATIAAQVGMYYKEALARLNVAPLKNHFNKNWLLHIQLKAAFFDAEACYRYSLKKQVDREFAEEIARLNSGIDGLSVVKKLSSKGAEQQLLDKMNELKRNLKSNLKRATKDNDNIYRMKVPDASSLPPIPATSFVESLPMNDTPESSKDKMFASLVPKSSERALMAILDHSPFQALRPLVQANPQILQTSATPTTAPQGPAAASALPAPAAATPSSAVAAVSESNVYGLAALNLVAGSKHEGEIQQILDIGGGCWDRDTVVRAFRAAFNNPERAIEYLYSGIPEQAEVPPVVQAPATGLAANYQAQPPQPAQSAPVPSNGPNANPLDLFPQEHQGDFLRQINEPVEGGEGNILGPCAAAMRQSPEDCEARERLEAMGFDPAIVLEVFFACNKNEELAANYLLDHMHEFEE